MEPPVRVNLYLKGGGVTLNKIGYGCTVKKMPPTHIFPQHENPTHSYIYIFAV